MRSLSIIITVWLALTNALPHHGPLVIPIHKRWTLAKNGIVDLDAARSHIAYSERKYLQGFAALDSTGVLSSSSGGSTLTRRAVGASSLTDQGNVRWYGTVSVGSPAVEYEMEFDTGSADLFLPASNCDSTCDGHTLYNPNASSSAVDLYQNFSLAYGDGSTVSGELYADTVTIGGVVAKNQTIGAALQYSTGFDIANFAPDGLMGMAFANISGFNANPVVETLIAERQLSDPVFAFKLASSGSELSIGGVDSSLYTGSFSYAPVTQQGFWQINLDSINGNNQALRENVPAIVDTGTTFILGDAEAVGQFYSALNATNVGSGFYTMPCNAMPNVSITIGGKSFALSAETFNLGSYNSSGNSCIGAVAGTGSLGGIWILGDVFLRNVYSVFDVGQLRPFWTHNFGHTANPFLTYSYSIWTKHAAIFYIGAQSEHAIKSPELHDWLSEMFTMSVPSTKIIDHIVHLTPPGTVEQVSRQFSELGFKVIAGGTHAGGFTANALVILGDGAYLELISFTHPASHYPPGSPDRQRRDAGPWAHKDPGWIDFAFLGSSSTSIARIINARAERDHSGIRYAPNTPGGRRTDGRVLQWVINATEDDRLRGIVPFFCGDVTPREWRVPVEPPSNAVHPSGVEGVAYVRLLVQPEALASVSAQLTSVVGEPPRSNGTGSEYVWTLEVPSVGTSGSQKPRLILNAPTNGEEQTHLATTGPGIFEVGFWVGRDGVEREASTPYGKIVWLRSS